MLKIWQTLSARVHEAKFVQGEEAGCVVISTEVLTGT